MTIYWTYTSIQSIFDLFPAGELRDLLGKDEQAYLDHLRFEKRRREWLAGRLALKTLLIESFQNLASKRFNQLQILKEEGGLRVSHWMRGKLPSRFRSVIPMDRSFAPVPPGSPPSVWIWN
jgi:hypothetical protein